MPSPSAGADWLSFVKESGNANGVEFDLRQLGVGDVLRVITGNTVYDFKMTSSCEANLRTNRAGRPSGEVRIMGCTFGESSSIKPNHLFCGGNLKFVFQDGEMTHLTSSIREIHWLRRSGKESEGV